MAHTATEGLVIRVRTRGTDSYLTLLNPQKGRFTLLAKGARSIKNKEGQMGISQQFVHGDFEHYRRGDMEILKGGVILTAFHQLPRKEEELHLAYYLCEVTEELTDVGEPAADIYRMILNSLYDLDRGLHPAESVKAAFELRIAALTGYAPDLSACAQCGKGEGSYLDVAGGALLCADCLRRRPVSLQSGSAEERSLLCPLTPGVLSAMRYILSAPLSRLFSFELSDGEDRALLSRAAQEYLLYHLGRSFYTLESYLSVLELKKSSLRLRAKQHDPSTKEEII